MKFKSSEDITSKIDFIVSNTFTGMLCSIDTLTKFAPEEKRLKDDLPIWVLSRFTASIDEYKKCTVYIFHNLQAGELQVFVGSRYPMVSVKYEDKLQKEKQLMDIVRSTYKYCLRCDEAKWQEFWDVLNLEYENLDILDQFVFKLIDIRDSSVGGDVNLKDVVNCNKLANMVCNVMRDMGGEPKKQ